MGDFRASIFALPFVLPGLSGCTVATYEAASLHPDDPIIRISHVRPPGDESEGYIMVSFAHREAGEWLVLLDPASEQDHVWRVQPNGNHEDVWLIGVDYQPGLEASVRPIPCDDTKEVDER